jgi:hypothetical protein
MVWCHFITATEISWIIFTGIYVPGRFNAAQWTIACKDY